MNESLRDYAVLDGDRLQSLWAEIDRLRDLLSEAVEDIQSWGGYASEYFQDKHDLKGCIARYRSALDVGVPVDG